MYILFAETVDVKINIRKVAHFCEYALLGAETSFLCLLTENNKKKKKSKSNTEPRSKFTNSLFELLPRKLINYIIEKSEINPNKKVNDSISKKRKIDIGRINYHFGYQSNKYVYEDGRDC